MASPWEEQSPPLASAEYGVPAAQLAEERAGWSWAARLWLLWWLLIVAALAASLAAAIDGPQAWAQWGGGMFVFGLFGAFVTLAPCLTWYAEYRVRNALDLVTWRPQAQRRHRGWSLGGILWLIAEILLPMLGFFFLILAQNPNAKDAAGGLLAFWLGVVFILFFIHMAWVRRRVRLARVMESSYLMNFTYADEVHCTRWPVWRMLPLFDRSKVQSAWQVMEGRVGSLPVTVLEWCDPELAAKTGRSGHLVVIVPEGVPVPAFELQPRQSAMFGGQGWSLWLHLLHGPVGLVILFLHWMAHRIAQLSQAGAVDAREVPLDHTPGFARKYKLLGHDEPGIELLFTPELCDHLLRQRADWIVQSDGSQLLLCNLRASSDPRKHPQVVAECLHLAHLLHETFTTELATVKVAEGERVG